MNWEGSIPPCSSFGFIFVITHSVISIVPATDAAFSRANLVTLVGSMIPLSNISTYCPVLGLNPDRADVIIPATKIFLSAMKHSEIEKIIVPQIGLSDGIIHLLYDEYKAKQVKK